MGGQGLPVGGAGGAQGDLIEHVQGRSVGAGQPIEPAAAHQQPALGVALGRQGSQVAVGAEQVTRGLERLGGATSGMRRFRRCPIPSVSNSRDHHDGGSGRPWSQCKEGVRGPTVSDEPFAAPAISNRPQPSSTAPDPSAADPTAPDPATLRSLPLGPEHLEACLALDADCLGGLWSRAQWQGELAEPAARPCLGVFSAGGELAALACGWLVLDELHITVVGVRRAWQRRGLGQRVLAALLAEGQRRGAARATLEVAAGNAAGQALYAKAGFRTAGHRRRYYRNGDDALIQWRRMEASAG